ncbi:MAG: hypothetical protein ACFCGT_00220 [Sandaracinaceae bacterium]
MHRHTLSALATLTALLVGGPVAPSVAAAQVSPQARPVFGTANLDRGFQPDPRLFTGRAGGPVSAQQAGGGCRGSITAAPSHVIQTRSGFNQVRLMVQSDADTTLVVMLPNGRVVCDDDGGGGLNPLVQTGTPAGPIRVWVGVYNSGQTGSPYTLGVSELAHITPANLQSSTPPVALDPSLGPAYGAANLASGFLPDPHLMRGTSGGPVRASQLQGDCRGYISRRPSHVLTTTTGFRLLQAAVNAGQMDTTLVVQLPSGQVLCDDDGGSGTNPLLTATSPPGQIRVWVGSYRQNEAAPYTIGFSERGNLTTASIPAPGAPVPAPLPPGHGGTLQVATPPTVVQMQASIPVTLLGPGLSAETVAVWHPSRSREVQVALSGDRLTVAGANVLTVPAAIQEGVVTVTQGRRGDLLVRAERAPSGGDPGRQVLLLVRWSGGPQVAEEWSGTFQQRAPRWARRFR